MTRLGQRSRVLLSTCAYVFVVVAVVGGAFSATMALMPGESAAATARPATAGKIGPGYARMQPADRGKPEKVVYSTPYYPHVATPSVSRSMKQHAPAIIATAPVVANTPPLVVTAIQSSYNSPDLHHRVY